MTEISATGQTNQEKRPSGRRVCVYAESRTQMKQTMVEGLKMKPKQKTEKVCFLRKHLFTSLQPVTVSTENPDLFFFF